MRTVGIIGLGLALAACGLSPADTGATGGGEPSGTGTHAGGSAPTSSSGIGAHTGSSTGPGGGATGTGGASTGSGGGASPPPTLDSDGCPTVTGVGSNTQARTAMPSGVTTTFYVSASGDDANDGASQAHAFQSMARVQQAIDAGDVRAGVAVLFHAGDVFHGTLALTAANTGSAQAPVVLGAYGAGDAPTLVGTKVVDASTFTQQGAEYVAPITGAPARLFFGADEVFQARFPNAAANHGDAVIHAVSGTSTSLVVASSDLAGLPVAGAYAYVRTVSWRRDRVHVDSATTSGANVTLAVSKAEVEPGGPVPNNGPAGLSTPAAVGSGVFFEGLIDYLDVDGEWAITNGELHLRPPGAWGSQPIEVSLPGAVIDATGVTNLVVQDLHVSRGEGSGLRANVNGAGPEVTNTRIDEPYYGGVALSGAPQPTLADNTVTGSRNVGITVSGGTGAVIRNNEIASSGASQYATYSFGVGLTGTGGTIEDNSIHDVGHAGVQIGLSTSTTVQRNLIVRSPSYFGDSAGIYWNYDGGGQLVTHNVVCKTSSNVDDTAPNPVGQTRGIYLDDDVRPATIDTNTVIDAGLCGLSMVSQGTDVDTPNGPEVPSHTVTSNVIIGSGDHAGQGQEGAQVCYSHAMETTGGANTPTLGQLRSMAGNVLVATQRWQRAGLFTSYEANHDFGAIDGNLLLNPLAQGVVDLSEPGAAATTLLSLEGWVTASEGKDATSVGATPRRVECDLTHVDAADLITATTTWSGTSDVGATSIHLPAPGSGMTQAFIVDAPIAVTSGEVYVVELDATSTASEAMTVYLTGAASAVDATATSVGSILSDPATQHNAFAVRATGAALTLQIVANAAITFDQISVRRADAASCAASLDGLVRVLTNTERSTQRYDVGAGWLDVRGAPITAPVEVAPFESVVVQRAAVAL